MHIFIYYNSLANLGLERPKRLVATATPTINPTINNMNWDRYQRLETIYNYISKMESLHPDIVQVLSIPFAL